MTRQMPADMGRTVSIGLHRSNAFQMTVAVGYTARTNGKVTVSLLFPSLLKMLSTAFRFQRKEYGAIDIVMTEKKGFGLRAGTDLPK